LKRLALLIKRLIEKTNILMQVKLLTAHVTLHHKNTGQDTEELVGFPRKTEKGSILR
jgi:hypothetical protein